MYLKTKKASSYCLGGLAMWRRAHWWAQLHSGRTTGQAKQTLEKREKRFKRNKSCLQLHWELNGWKWKGLSPELLYRTQQYEEEQRSTGAESWPGFYGAGDCRRIEPSQTFKSKSVVRLIPLGHTLNKWGPFKAINLDRICQRPVMGNVINHRPTQKENLYSRSCHTTKVNCSKDCDNQPIQILYS